MRLDSLVFELYAWGGRETVAELRWRLQRRGHRVEVKVAKQGLQILRGGFKPGVAELWGLYTRGCRVGVRGFVVANGDEEGSAVRRTFFW